jgi:hypothetical protein
MKFVMFIHNDDVKCFRVAIQGSHKLVAMGHINFKDHVLIKKWRADEKMNVIGEMFKDKKKRGNHQKQFAIVARSCARFWSFGIHNSMNAKNAIEKLHWITREKKT